jgi:hypothetical protein
MQEDAWPRGNLIREGGREAHTETYPTSHKKNVPATSSSSACCCLLVVLLLLLLLLVVEGASSSAV